MHFALSQGLPYPLYLFFADLEVLPVLGEDFEGKGFVVLSLIEFSQYLFEINNPGTDRKMIVLFPEVVIGMDMANSVTILMNEL